MNADPEGGKSELAARLWRTRETAGVFSKSQGTEQKEVYLPSQWQGDRQNDTSSASPMAAGLSPITINSGESDRLPVRLISHATVLVLLGAALLLGRVSWAPWLAVPTLPRPGLWQRVALVAPQTQVSYTATSLLRQAPDSIELNRRLGMMHARGTAGPSAGLERGFLRRRIPPVTAETVDTPEEPVHPSPELGAGTSATLSAGLGRGGSRFVDAGFVTRGIDPEGSLMPIPRTDIVTYTVRYGDTLWDIAAKFNITQDTLWANNDLPNPDMLSVGTVLVIPPVDGLIYTVRKGDTLAGVAKRYRTTVEAVVNYAPNGLGDGQELTVGQKIMIPGGVKPIPPRRTVSLVSAPAGALKGAGSFIMPISGTLTQGFRPGHPAIDISAPKGTPVYAADAGYVSFAGWHPWGYGYAVEIDHGNGFRTLYAHLSWYAPDLGQSVKRGDLIGGVGSTYGSGGWSSGPHLHFEIIHNGAKRNPCVFLACP